MATDTVQFDTEEFSRGAWVAGVVVLSVAFVVLGVLFAVGSVLMEHHAKAVDGGERVSAAGLSSVRRSRSSTHTSVDDDGEEDEDEEDECEHDAEDDEE
jgi:hypothetical protein